MKCLAVAAVTFLLVPAAAFADPMSVYGADESGAQSRVGLSIRGGVGSLFGPAFGAGQPEYAHSDGFDWQNRRPFGTPQQTAMTFGLAASLTTSLGAWSVGPTAVVGFNATHSSSDSFSDIVLEQSLTGLSFGGGLRAAHGTGPIRLTLDAIATRSALHGKVDWQYSDFFGSDTLVGHGEWDVSFIRVAAMVGVEVELAPLFVFVNGGAQFLPEQERTRRAEGAYPQAHTNDPFHAAVVSEVQSRGKSTVTFENELSFAASAGIGLRF